MLHNFMLVFHHIKKESQMKNLKIIFVSIVLVLSTITNANAMGEREKGALIGAGAAVLLFPAIFGHNESSTRYVEPPRREVVYVEQPRERVVYREPYVRERVIIIDDDSRRHHPTHHDDRYYERSYERPYYGR